MQNSSSEARGLHNDSGLQRVLVRVKGKICGLSIQKTNAWIIPETDDATPRAEVAPADKEIGRGVAPDPHPAALEAAAAPRPEETQGVRLEREARDLAAVWQSSRQLGQPLGEGGLSSGSNLSAHVGHEGSHVPRLVHAEARRKLQKRDEAWLADRARELAEAGGQGELSVPRVPEEPTADERARHEVTHLPYQPWCAWFVMGKGRAKPLL